MIHKQSFFCALLFIFSFNLKAQDKLPKNYQGLLWEISGNGLKTPSYLYGTMHVSNKLAFHLSDSFFIALNRCNVVALELNFNEWMDDFIQEGDAMERLFFLRGSGYNNSFYTNAVSLDMANKEELKLLLKSYPQIINQMMYRNTNSKSDFEEDNYLDIFINQAGHKLNKKVIGLENFMVTEKIRFKASQRDVKTKKEKELEMEEREQNRIKLRELLKDGSEEDLSFENAYRTGNLDLLDTLNKLQSDKRYMKYMLFERNVIMANGIDSVIRREPMFTGVGAAHLPGPEGVIELLRAKGYKLRPVVFTSKNDIKLKNEIDEKHFPVVFTKQTVSDSLFSVETPGKLYELSQSGPYKSYLCNDMANGSYYYIQRLNHYARLTGKDQQSVLLTIDSLLYENIPGKILSKREIKSNNGWPGLEITNKTRKGDHQKYLIFVSPDEIITFKMSGTNEYLIKGTESKQFFNSIQFIEKPEVKKRHEFKNLGLIVSLNSKKSVYQSTNRKYAKQLLITSNEPDKSYKLISVSACNDFEFIEEDTFELNMLRDRFMLETGFKPKQSTYLSHQNYPALQCRFSNPLSKTDSIGYFRQIINGSMYYSALVLTPSEEVANQFFKEIEVMLPSGTLNNSVYKDTSLHFSVNLNVPNAAYDQLLYTTMDDDNGGYYGSRQTEEEKKQEIYLPKRLVRTYFNKATNECVMVAFKKYSMYYQQESMDKLWDDELDRINRNKSFKITKLENKKIGEVETYTCLMTDTNSTRGIYVKFFHKCATLYTLKAVIDTVGGLSPFKKEFYGSFTPADTCIGKPIAEDKLTSYFFKKVTSTDSTERKTALTTIDYVRANMQKSHVPVLRATIADSSFSKLETNQKTALIRALAEFPSKETDAFLASLYTTNMDSIEIQLAILGTLAQSRNSASASLFLKLLNTDLPVTANTNWIEDCFDGFEDSLVLAKSLFPGILKYAKYDIYKSTLYGLLMNLVHKNIVKPKEYASFVENIALDAMYDLKIYLTKDDNRYYGNNRYRDDYEEVSMDNFKSFYSDADQKIMTYVGLLAPHYKKPVVKKFFDKLDKSAKEDVLRVYASALLLKSGTAIPEQVWSDYAKDIKFRFAAYKALSSFNMQSKLKSEYISQDQIVASFLYGQFFNDKKDTFNLVRKISVFQGSKSQLLYVFKSRPKDKKTWKLSMSGPHPMDGKLLDYSPFIVKNNVSFNSEKQIEKEIKIAMQKIRIKDRDRARLDDFEKRSYGGYGDYDF